MKNPYHQTAGRRTHATGADALILALLFSIVALLAPPASAAPSSWATAGGMHQSRLNHTATLLADGRLLVAGGDDGADVYRSTAELWDPTTGAWTTTGGMAYGRSGHTATLLPDGRVLVAGGYGLEAGSAGLPFFLASAEIFDPASGVWSPAGTMGSPRRGHTATLLADGDVLLAGGQSGDFAYTSSADLYTPSTGAFTVTGNLPSERRDHSATLLSDGRVLIVGGYAGNSGTPPVPTYLSSAALYDPDLGSFSATDPITGNRARHTATLLRNGLILVAGGRSYRTTPAGTFYRNTAYTFNPATAAWTAVGSLSTARGDHTASLLPDGRVLVCGGTDGAVGATCEVYSTATSTWSTGSSLVAARSRHTITVLPDGYLLAAGGLGGADSALTSAERFEPPAGSCTDADDLSDGRDWHTATLLEDGTVLVAGGQRETSADILASCERYDPATDLWSLTGNMATSRYRHTATRLTDGRVLVVGGYSPAPIFQMSTAEVYDPGTGDWGATGSMTDRRYLHTATLLADGRVLVVGGTYYDGATLIRLASAEVYDPARGTWSVTGSMAYAREMHTATLLPDGRVLVTGGNGPTGTTADCELYDPATAAWSATGSLSLARREHSATLLPDGRVLVVGGGFGSTYQSLTELYRPWLGSWVAGDDLGTGFVGHRATLLPDGRPLVVGGYGGDGSHLAQVLSFDPAEDVWSMLPSMGTVKARHTATLLRDGRVLIAAGSGTSSATKVSAELYTSGLGFDEAWRPVLDAISKGLRVGDPASLTGTGLRGSTEGSGGGAQSSSSGVPLAQVRRLDNEQIMWLSPDPESGFSDTAYPSGPLAEFPSGPTLVTVFANGIPSMSQPAVVLPDLLFADGFEDGTTSRWSSSAP